MSEHATVAMINAAIAAGQRAAMSTIGNTAQQAADAYWKVATSDGPEARSDSVEYINATEFLVNAIMDAYGMTEANARAVREYVSEYGPDDSLMQTSGRGVASYVQKVYYDRAQARKEWKAALLRGESSKRRQDYYDARSMSDEELIRARRYCYDLARSRMLEAMITRRTL